jgi:hypothetical protein
MRLRWKWISASIVAALLGVGFWLRQRPAAPPIGAIAAQTSPAPLVPLWRASTSIPAIEASKQGADPDEIEVCGVGKLKLDRADWTATDNYLDALTKNKQLRWLAALRDSDDYRARAAGLYLEGLVDRASPRKDPGAARDELVQLALATKDPAAFALANAKCANQGENIAASVACPQFSLEDWARADADNAVPWLQLAAKARREGDAAAEGAAFARAAQAHQYESYNWSLLSFAQASMPSDVTPTERWILSWQIIGVEAAMVMPYQPQFRYCSADALANPVVHAQCSSLAELMVKKSANILESSVGNSLGARIGWPQERVDKMKEEVKASLEVLNQEITSDPKQPYGCDSVAKGNAYMAQWGELGERGLARQAIERSGESVAELARKYDERIAALTREAQERAPDQAPQ